MSFSPGMLSALSQLPQGAGNMTQAYNYAPTTDWSSTIGAGIQAGGQTIGTLAQIIAQSAARQQGLQQADLGRTSSLRLAKMQIQAAAEAAEKERQFRAQQMLLQQLGRGASSAMKDFDTKRMANQAGSSLIAQTFF